MIDYLRSRLGARLLLSYLAIILLGAVILVSATQLSLPGAFDRHLAGMGPQMMGQGRQPGGPPPMRMNDLYDGFRASFNDALAYALLASGLAALLVSLFFSRSVVAPLRAMMKASQRIAEGHYDERVRVSGSDELAQLGARFNSMAGRLEQTETMRRQLLGDVSHELRTPLTAIGGYMEGLIDGVLPATPETYEQVRHEALRLGRLVDDLQELSRVESGSFHLDLRPISLSVPLATTAKRLALQFDEKQITLTLDLPADPSAGSGQVLPPVLADEDRLTQVLTNLLANALAYTPAGGAVTVSAQKTGGELRVAVMDSGVGIPPEHLAHIFDRFYRVDASRSRGAGGGSGIGLTIARRLVEAHGGRMWAESDGENKGSVFFFTLPVGK
jgi:histidine kinase